MSQKARPRKTWTKEEDDKLWDSVNEYDGKDINWQAVALSIPRWNNKDCRKRWAYSLEPSYVKGPWAEEEDTLLRKGVEIHPDLNWAKISQVVGSRQPDQCSRHWHECVKPNINHGRWSPEEDQILKEAVEEHGRRWTEIVDQKLRDRTPITAKRRYIACFENPSDQGVKNKTHVEAEEAQDPDESPASDDYSRYHPLEQRFPLLQDARDLGQRQPRQFLPPAETFERAGNPPGKGLNPMSSSSIRSAYEGSNPARMWSDPAWFRSNDNRGTIPASDYPLQPHVIPPTPSSIQSLANETSERVKSRIVSHDPWYLSFAEPNSHGGMPFPRAGAPSPDSETPVIKNTNFSRYSQGPKALSSHDSHASGYSREDRVTTKSGYVAYDHNPSDHRGGPESYSGRINHARMNESASHVKFPASLDPPTSHDGPEVSRIGTARVKDDPDADSAYTIYTDRPEDVDPTFINTSDRATVKCDDADLGYWTTHGDHAFQEDFAQGTKGQVAPKRDYTYWSRSLGGYGSDSEH